MVGVGAEVVVWNDNNGTESTAKIFEVIQKKHGRVGRLEEPFGSKMGLFDLERLIKEGKSESFGFYVFLPERWDKDKNLINEKYRNTKRIVWPSTENSDRAKHLRALGLDPNSSFSDAEIVSAYRVAAKSAYPDLGGSAEAFQRLNDAYKALSEGTREPNPFA